MMNRRFVLPTLALLTAFLVAGPAFAASANTFGEAVGRSPLEAAGVALLGGLLVSLTPCVYPMVAITVAVFGATQSKGRWHGFGLSAAFVLGIVAMMTPLGVAAGLTGSLFGSVLQNPWVLVAISSVFLAMAASMFGAFEVTLPSSLTNRLAQMGGIGPKGAFTLGLVTGLIAAPCTGPVLTGILTWIAQSQNPVAGAAAMASFSLGLGFPFLLVGTFAVQLPKSGRWMVGVKSLLAIVLSVVALYFLSTAFPSLAQWAKPGALTYPLAATAIVVGVLLGAIHRDFHSPLIEDKLMKGIGALMATIATFVVVIALSTPERSLEWVKVPYAEARATALAENRPLLVDFSASWCGACKELDKVTFAHPEVNQAAGRFVAVKIDATDDEDPVTRAAMQELNVVGLPTVVVFDSEGAEAKRFTDFVQPEEFLKALEPVE